MLITPLKQVLNNLKSEKSQFDLMKRSTGKSVHRWFKWLSPGLFVKRWLLISVTGILLILLGLAIVTGLTPIFHLIALGKEFLGWIANIIPNSISGPVIIILGLFFLYWGQTRTVNSITEALKPNDDQELVDLLLSHRKLHKGPKIVAIGGGTGLSSLLRGLKRYSANITAIVTVADDGGSSGRLRREIGVLPPGDIRNCIAALADEEKLLTELFQYRFTAGDGLNGHSFGNLFLTAMSEITGDLERAIATSSKVLAIRGKVLPATLSDVRLWAKMEDGRIIEGESNIPEAKGKISEIGCFPPNPPALPAVIKAIFHADFIVIGPGSLYTSVIPNLLVPEIREALAKTRVPRIYICNIMTQPGETDGYTVSDHIRAIDQVCGKRLFDAVVCHQRSPSPYTLQRYAKEGAHPVFLDREEVTKLGRRVILGKVMDEDEKGYVRHDPISLASVLLRWYGKSKGLKLIEN